MKVQEPKNSPPSKTEKQLDEEAKGEILKENQNYISNTKECVNSVDSPEKAIYIPQLNEIKKEIIAKQKENEHEQKNGLEQQKNFNLQVQVSLLLQGKLAEEDRNKKTVQIGKNTNQGALLMYSLFNSHFAVLSFLYLETVNFLLSIWSGWTEV